LLWWGTAQAPAAAKKEDEVRPLWRPAFRAHVAAVMFTELINVRLRLRVCRVHRRFGYGNLVRCNVNRCCALPAARSLSARVALVLFAFGCADLPTRA
jgi:hypothetical protein